MSKYIKLEDAISKIVNTPTRIITDDLTALVNRQHEIIDMLSELPTIEVSEDDLYIPLNNQTVERINRLHKNECGDYFDEEWLFNELEQISEFREVSEDCISREWLETNFQTVCENVRCSECPFDDDDCRLIKFIVDAPSVVPSRPQGEWIPNPDGGFRCSNCRAEEDEFIYGTGMRYVNGESEFCPNCGAKMKGGAE